MIPKELGLFTWAQLGSPFSKWLPVTVNDSVMCRQFLPAPVDIQGMQLHALGQLHAAGQGGHVNGARGPYQHFKTVL